MSSNKEKDKKKMSRAERNLAAANASRARKKLHKAQLIEEKSYLTERNAILRQQLELMPTVGGIYAGTPGAGSSSRHHGSGNPDMVQLSERMSQLFGGRKEISSAAAVDLFDRALTGSKGKGPPVDPELCALWQAAQRAAPKNPKTALRADARAQGRPLVTVPRSAVTKAKSGSKKRSAAGSSSGGGSSSRRP